MLKELNSDIISYLFSQPDDFIMSYLGLSSAQELETDKRKAAGGYTTHAISFKNFLLVRKDNDEVIGRAGFHTWFPLHSRAEIGYAISNEMNKGKGYMKEALTAMIAYGFNEMKLNRIEALIGRKNVPSLKLVHHFGFVQEGIFREHYCNNGIIEDSLCFSLLRSDYSA